MKNICGVVYILTNPSFPEYVKIGYADNIEERLKQLNRSECIPFAFRLYAYYKVSNRLTDMKLHTLIDKLNPNLRSVETFNGKKRTREFYAMEPEQAFGILETIAEMNNLKENLILVNPSEKEIENEEAAQEIRVKRTPIKKPNLKHLIKWEIIHIGDILYYKNHPNEKAKLLDEDGNVDFNGEIVKYMEWGRKVLNLKHFNFYDYVFREGSNKTLATERLEYMIEHDISVDENFNE